LSARVDVAEAAATGELANPPSPVAVTAWRRDQPPRTPLDQLCAFFQLDRFERDVLVLCAGCELDAAFAALCRRAAVDPSRARPTLGLVLACLPDAHWSALAPHAPLRAARLVRVASDAPLSDAQLTIDEPVLHYLLDGVFWDPALDGLATPLELEPSSLGSVTCLATKFLGVWQGAQSTRLPLIQVIAADPAAALELAATVASQARAPLVRIDATLLPTSSTEAHAKLEAWTRSAQIEGSIAVMDAASQAPDSHVAHDALARWLDQAQGPMIFVTRHRRAPGTTRTWVSFELESPPAHEQAQLWSSELARRFPEHGAQAAVVQPLIEQLVGAFDMAAGRIRAACAHARGDSASTGAQATTDALAWSASIWHACRVQARPDLDALAKRLHSTASWSDLCVAEETRVLLAAVCRQVRDRSTVHGRWGVGSRTGRGLGIAALFTGPSGTGKTLAAEVIGGDLQLDVYRVDLSAVVSKYIGETEKNLSRVFDAAEGSGVILLFDEADALFGKRTEVKDSHDRHANVEVGYLLQRMEAYRGLAILTSNLRSDLDGAFLRRLRFIIDFKLPTAAQRRELWVRALSEGAPLAHIDFEALAELQVSGGQIRNISINAAFAAAGSGRPIDAEQLRCAIIHEFEKTERSLSNAELERLSRWARARSSVGQLP
jgi:hypothetical protein